eukprot:jgi/Tetstr1/439229/TSEL_027671.t1
MYAGPACTIEGTLDLSPRLTLGQLPRMFNSAIKNSKGLFHFYVAATLAHSRLWRTFFDVFAQANTAERVCMMSKSGHGSVAYQTYDTPADACDYRPAMRKCSGVASLGAGALESENTCPHCDLSPGAFDEAMERRIVRCPRAGA